MKPDYSFTFRAQWLEALSALPVGMQALSIKAIVDYGLHGILPDDPVINAITYYIRAEIDRENEKKELRRRRADARKAQKTQIKMEIVDQPIASADADAENEQPSPLEATPTCVQNTKPPKSTKQLKVPKRVKNAKPPKVTISLKSLKRNRLLKPHPSSIDN